MPGTLPTHQTSQDMLASASESLSATQPVSTHSSGGSTGTGSGTSTGNSGAGSGLLSGSSGRAGEGQHQLTAASFDNTMSADTSGSANTVRMGKLLDSQPRTRTTVHHHG